MMHDAEILEQQSQSDIKAKSNGEFLEDFLSEALLLTKSSQGSIQMVEEGRLRTLVHANFPSKISNRCFKKDGTLITDHVLRLQETVNISDFQKMAKPDATFLCIGSFLSAPLISEGKAFGILTLIHKEMNAFSPVYLEILGRMTPHLVSRISIIQKTGEECLLKDKRIDLNNEKDANSILRSLHDEHPLKHHSFSILSKVKPFRETRELLRDFIKDIVSEEALYNINLAFGEVHSNIIEHGYARQVGKEIRFEFFVFKNRTEICMIDYGPGFVQKTLKNDVKGMAGLNGSGLGVFLIHELLDSVQYSNHPFGNLTRLVKYRS